MNRPAVFLPNAALKPWLNSAFECAREQLASAIAEIERRRLDAVIVVFDKRLMASSRRVIVTLVLRPRVLELAPRLLLPEPIRLELARGAAPVGSYHCLSYRAAVDSTEETDAADVHYGLLQGVAYAPGGSA